MTSMDYMFLNIFSLYIPAGNFIAVLLTSALRDFDNPRKKYIQNVTFTQYAGIVIFWPYYLVRITVEYLTHLLRSARRQKKK